MNFEDMDVDVDFVIRKMNEAFSRHDALMRQTTPNTASARREDALAQCIKIGLEECGVCIGNDAGGKFYRITS